jgi:phosphosulfolactate synthase
MLTDLLDLPARSVKPRPRGLTMVIDGGLPTGAFEDAMAAVAELVDVVKLGWGTAIVTPDLDFKLSALRALGIPFYLGGTLFEKFVAQDRFDAFVDLCLRLGTDVVEVSNGTIPMTNTAKAAYIRRCADHFRVISEVGYKDSDRSQRMAPSQWVDCIGEDLDAGASLVITEARESGRSGICRPDGELRFGLVEDILASGVDVDRLLFEAPSKDLQTYFVTRVGPDVNLGNIHPTDVINLETLRLGLRADTMMHFEQQRRDRLRRERTADRDRRDHTRRPRRRDLPEAVGA